MRRAFVLAAIGAAAAGCGGSSSESDPVALAAEKTSHVATARFTMNISIRDPQQGSLDFRGPGVISEHGHVMWIKATLPAKEVGAPGKGEVGMEMIGTDNAFYYRGAPFRPLLKPGKTWVEVRSTNPQLGQDDPGAMLLYLRATSKLHRLGQANVNGVQTTQYSVRTQIQKALQLAKPADRKRVEGSAKQLTAAGITEVPFDVWVDNDGYIRRLVIDWKVGGRAITGRVDDSDFGKAPAIAVPAQSRVVDVTSLAGGLP
jgi:hypothetical protein